MKDFWDERYNSDEYIYGKAPNEYLKEKLDSYNKGKILLPADGEGRNAVFASLLGWETTSFDISTEGKNKALKLAKENNISIKYDIFDYDNLNYEKNFFDYIGFFYAHFSSDIRNKYYKKILEYLKPNGFVIFEAFSKKQLEYQKNNNSGGPKDINILFSIEETKNIFDNFTILELEEKEVLLQEGSFHNGLGSVIRFLGKKNN
ncbi:MAG: class I SAM-dependent methyltransferase [Candidatus Sericytochromatia bacterium]